MRCAWMDKAHDQTGQLNAQKKTNIVDRNL
jgi:hypothetical protein